MHARNKALVLSRNLLDYGVLHTEGIVSARSTCLTLDYGVFYAEGYVCGFGFSFQDGVPHTECLVGVWAAGFALVTNHHQEVQQFIVDYHLPSWHYELECLGPWHRCLAIAYSIMRCVSLNEYTYLRDRHSHRSADGQTGDKDGKSSLEHDEDEVLSGSGEVLDDQVSLEPLYHSFLLCPDLISDIFLAFRMQIRERCLILLFLPFSPLVTRYHILADSPQRS